MAAMDQNPSALEFAGNNIKNDFFILKPYLCRNPEIIIFTSRIVRETWLATHPKLKDTVPGIQAIIAKDTLEAMNITHAHQNGHKAKQISERF